MTDAYFPKSGGFITGAIGVNNGTTMISGDTDAYNTLAQFQAVKDGNNASLLQIERPLDNTTNPTVGFYQKKNGGAYERIGTILHTGNMNLISSVPSGIIVMWSGASTAIPTGWLLCNGANNTPDLRDRFIVGAGYSYGVGYTGGEATHTLTVNEMPSHNHSATLSLSGLSTSSAGSHTHNLLVADDNNQSYSGVYPVCDNYVQRPVSTSGGVAAAGDHTHTISGSGSVTVNSNGSGSAHENRPPYYALCFIMKQ